MTEQMLNKQPIFLNCFSRGGSNILWNIFLTHPDVCSPIHETLEIFRLDRKGVSLAGLKAAWLTRQPRFFDQWSLETRKPVSAAAAQFIDRTLYEWKLKTLEDGDMRYRREEEVYDRSQVEGARLVAKNNNGLTFLSDRLLDVYPDATFVALVRDPLALFESHKRRNIIGTVHKFARFYESLVERMLADSERLPRYHVVKFEDLLADPIGMMQQLYRCADLDFRKVSKVRFKAKAHLHADGQHATAFTQGAHYWFAPADVYDILNPRINQYQIGQLGQNEKEMLLALTEESRRRLGYHIE